MRHTKMHIKIVLNEPKATANEKQLKARRANENTKSRQGVE